MPRKGRDVFIFLRAVSRVYSKGKSFAEYGCYVPSREGGQLQKRFRDNLKSFTTNQI
jgi:hypothetical protein